MFSIYPDIPLAAQGDGNTENRVKEKKKKRKSEEWHVNRKAVAMLQTAWLFCCTKGLFLIECDLISNTEFPSSPLSAAVTHSIAKIS